MVAYLARQLFYALCKILTSSCPALMCTTKV
uniref:Uncharacterized protein n=1 Tax=Arundo donax TaxID=35708 RepID=A0A0A9BTT4_ARUDO